MPFAVRSLSHCPRPRRLAGGGGAAGGALGAHGLLRGRRPAGRGPAGGAGPRLARQRLPRRGAVPFALQSRLDGPRPLGRGLGPGAAMALLVRPLGAPPRLFRRGTLLRRRQVDPRLPRLGQADRDRLLRGAGAVLALADVVHLLADEFPRLRRGRLALPLVLLGPLDRFLLRHVLLLWWRQSPRH